MPVNFKHIWMQREKYLKYTIPSSVLKWTPYINYGKYLSRFRRLIPAGTLKSINYTLNNNEVSFDIFQINIK